MNYLRPATTTTQTGHPNCPPPSRWLASLPLAARQSTVYSPRSLARSERRRATVERRPPQCQRNARGLARRLERVQLCDHYERKAGPLGEARMRLPMRMRMRIRLVGRQQFACPLDRKQLDQHSSLQQIFPIFLPLFSASRGPKDCACVCVCRACSACCLARLSN